MNISKWVLCIAVMVVAGINNFALGQSTIADEQMQMAITSMTVCGDNIFAGTKTKGVYRSTDGGKVWSQVNNGLSAPAQVLRLASIGKNIFVVGYFPSATMFTSTDNGDSWKKVTIESTGSAVTGVCLFNGRLYATTGKGLFVSVDEGADWAPDPGIKEGQVSTVIAAKNFVFIHAVTEAGRNEYYSSADGIKWTATNNDGVFPDQIEVSGDNVVGTYCQNNYSNGNRTTCHGYLLWILGKNAKKWQQADFKARYFGFDGDNIYAIKVQVIDNRKKDPEYERLVVKSDDRGRSWETVDEKTDPFVLADYGMQEKLHELDYWKSFEIEEILAYRRGQKLAAEKKEAEWQAEMKKRRAGPVVDNAYSTNKAKYATPERPDYRALSQDLYNARHNTHSYIDSKGGIHIR